MTKKLVSWERLNSLFFVQKYFGRTTSIKSIKTQRNKSTKRK